MEMPSLTRSPCAAVRLRRSDPAKSTKWNLLVIVTQLPSWLKSEKPALLVEPRFRLGLSDLPPPSTLPGREMPPMEVLPDTAGDWARLGVGTVEAGLGRPLYLGPVGVLLPEGVADRPLPVSPAL